MKRKNENPRPIDQSIWHRLETSGSTVYNTVQFCAGKGDKELQTNQNGTIFNKTRQYITYAGDVLIILGRMVRVTEEKVVTHIKEAAVSNGLVINESKTKYMKINRNVTNLEQDLIINGQIFEGVQNFTYLGTLINSKNVIHDEIKSRIAGGNRCFSSLRQTLRSRAMRKAVKIKTCKTMV